MDIERYYKTKAFRSWPHDEDGHIKGPEYDREDFLRVVRLTEEICKGDEPTFHAIMETFVKVYPEVKHYKIMTEGTYHYPEYGTIIQGISELDQKGQNARTALNRAETIRLTIKKGMLIGISIVTSSKTYALKADLTIPMQDRKGIDDNSYIHWAHYDLKDNKELNYILSLKKKIVNKDDAEFPAIKEFLWNTLERSRDERTAWQGFNLKMYETLKSFYLIIRDVHQSENQAFRRERRAKISRAEAIPYMKAVLEMDFDEGKLFH